MKLVIAIVRPTRLEAVKDRLGRSGIRGMTVSDVQGVGRQRGHTEIYRGQEYRVDLVRKVKIEIAVEDADLEKIIAEIMDAARSGAEGQIGDGKVFVLPLEEVVRIRTGERAEAAI
jgi:nitrogen regulatory protein P-II 1